MQIHNNNKNAEFFQKKNKQKHRQQKTGWNCKMKKLASTGTSSNKSVKSDKTTTTTTTTTKSSLGEGESRSSGVSESSNKENLNVQNALALKTPNDKSQQILAQLIRFQTLEKVQPQRSIHGHTPNPSSVVGGPTVANSRIHFVDSIFNVTLHF
ncbi:hypothetical protein RFI_17645, partial [Reticulomyxa filosa]